MRFVMAASQGDPSMTELCREYGISRPTGYLWLERFRSGGVSGVRERSRRPLSSPTRTGAAIEERIAELRRERPEWGARKLRVLLAREGLSVPRMTVHRVLLRKGLVREQDRVQQATRRFEREEPNQLWQMDFKSPKGWDQAVGPLSVLDDATRYVIALEGTWTTRWEPVRERLEAAFSDCGVPEAMLMDHGTPWWKPASGRGWTQLTVWLMKQDIRLYFSGVRHPQTQGKVERFHGALEMARRRRGLPGQQERQRWLDQFRQEYNHIRPHEALGMKTPASVWHPSPRAYQPHPAEWEYPEGAEVQRLEPTGQLKLNGRRWQISGPLAGERVQLVRIDQKVLVLYRNTIVRELDFAVQGSTMVEPCTASYKV
jgi:transposase InsO family protein